MRTEIFIELDSDGIITRGKTLLQKAFQEFAGKRLRITIEPNKRKRSNQQNAYYWSGFIEEEIQCFKEFWGEVYTKQQIHEWNKNMFFAEERLLNDEVIKLPTSTTVQTTSQFEDKLELGRQWFRINFGWEISYPNEQLKVFDT